MAWPTKSKYHEGLCDKAIELLGQGYSLAGVAAEFDIAECTIYEWRKLHPEFAEAVKIGVTKGKAWMEKQGRDSLWAAKDFNNGVYMFTMKSQYRVTDNSIADYLDAENAIDEDKVARYIVDVVSKEHPI